MEVSGHPHAPATLLSGLESPLSINRRARCEEIHLSRRIQPNFTPLLSGSQLSMTFGRAIPRAWPGYRSRYND